MSVIWHEAECAGYAADLELWEELAGATGSSVLDLGCGTGRVAIHLARRGHAVTGLDRDRDLIAAFAERARGLPAAPVAGDATRFELGSEFDLVLAPMQLVQLLEDARARLRCMRCIASHLRSGGTAAIAIVEEVPVAAPRPSPMPDTREVDGWVYSSLPVASSADSDAIRVRRLRQTVSPGGELSEELSEVSLRALDAARVEREAGEAGLRAAGRRAIPPTEEHVGSTVVLLERES